MNSYSLQSKSSIIQQSSSGKLLKWKIGNKFIKTSTLVGNTGFNIEFLYESYAEVVAYYIAKWLGFNVVKYNLCEVIIDNKYRTIACESEDFTKDRYEYISIGKLMYTNNLKLEYGICIDNYNSLIDSLTINGFKEYLDANIVLDYIVLNTDRHFGNFGLLRDIKTNTIIVPPIFDNGNSLLCNKFINGIKYYREIDRQLHCKPFSMYFDYQIKLIEPSISKETKNSIEIKLNKLLYRLVNEEELPQDRSDFIQELIIDRLGLVC